MTQFGALLVRLVLLMLAAVVGAFAGYVIGLAIALLTIDLPIGNSHLGTPLLGATLGAGFAVWLATGHRFRR